jgi:CO/xanthine dehydrogenase Mo-binding subunit
VQQSNFNDVRRLAMDETPAIDVLLEKSADPPRRGRALRPGHPPAVCNALAAAGKRVRALPIVQG